MAVDAYKDRNYDRKKQIFDVLEQSLQDIKYGTSHSSFGSNAIHGGTSWNKPIKEVKGVTMRFINERYLELTYHHYEVTTLEGLARLGDQGYKFLDEVVKELKKGFKNYTKKTLKLKEVKRDRSYEKHSRLQAETSWITSSSKHGYGGRPMGRYLVRESCVYDFGAKL